MTIKLKDLITEQDLHLPRGEKVVLKAEGSDYDRGLIVELLEDGGYNVQYWANDPSNIVPSEVKVDGEKVTDSGELVYLGFHPETDEE